MSRIVITALGSGGDVFPMVPIAAELQRRGHDCSLVVAPSVALALGGIDVPIGRVGPFLGQHAVRNANLVESGLFGYRATHNVFQLWLKSLTKIVDDLDVAVRDADLVLTHLYHPGAMIAAELHDVPVGTLNLFPCFMPTRHRAPPALPEVGPLDRVLWWAVLAGFRRRIDPLVNAERHRRGLPAHRDVALLDCLSEHLCLNLVHDFYTPPQPDWPVATTYVGYPEWDVPPKLVRRTPAELEEEEAFFSTDEPIVAVSLGTALGADPGPFFSSLVGALERLPYRAIIVGVPGDVLDGALPGRVLQRRYMPYSELLQKACTLVHHGGLGATHAALGAGRPSVVVHRCFDQPYNADRVRALEAGVAVPWSRLSPSRLADAIRDAVESSKYHAGAHAVRRLIEAAPKPGVAAADAVEKVLAG